MMLPKLPMPLLTKFSSLENPKFGLTVEISFHNLFLTFYINLLVLFLYSLPLPNPIVYFLYVIGLPLNGHKTHTVAWCPLFRGNLAPKIQVRVTEAG